MQSLGILFICLMFCFVHIEKAAGTTFHTILQKNFFFYNIITPWPYWTNEERNVFNKEEVYALRNFLRFSDGIGGHTVRSYIEYDNILNCSIDYITFLRDPVSRYISHFNYQKNKMNIDFSFSDFINEPRFNNFMTKRIAGSYNVEKAHKYLLKKFSFVGLVEKFDESLILMNRIVFGDTLDLYYEKRNVAKQYNNKYKEEYLEQIVKNNQLDIELYDGIFSVVYERYKELYGENLKENVIDFRNRNKKFESKSRLSRRILYRVYDVAFKILEQKAHRQYHDVGNDYVKIS